WTTKASRPSNDRISCPARTAASPGSVWPVGYMPGRADLASCGSPGRAAASSPARSLVAEERRRDAGLRRRGEKGSPMRHLRTVLVGAVLLAAALTLAAP